MSEIWEDFYCLRSINSSSGFAMSFGVLLDIQVLIYWQRIFDDLFSA